MLCEPKLSIKPVYLSSSTRSQYLLPHATFYTSSSCRLMLENILHVPDVRLNMISIGRRDEEGLSAIFQNGA